MGLLESWGTESERSPWTRTSSAWGESAWLLWIPRPTLLKTSSTACNVRALAPPSNLCVGGCMVSGTKPGDLYTEAPGEYPFDPTLMDQLPKSTKFHVHVHHGCVPSHRTGCGEWANSIIISFIVVKITTLPITPPVPQLVRANLLHPNRIALNGRP